MIESLFMVTTPVLIYQSSSISMKSNVNYTVNYMAQKKHQD